MSEKEYSPLKQMDPPICATEARLRNVLDKSGQWMSTSEGRIEWNKISSQSWDFEINPFIDSVSMGTCTGLIAYHRENFSAIKSRPMVRMYNHSGTLQATFYVDHPCKQAKIFVFMNDNVGVITDDGFIFIYSHAFAIKKSQVFKTGHLVAHCFWEDGVVALSSDGTIYESERFEKNQILTKLDSFSPPKAFEVIPSIYSHTNGTIVFIAMESGEVVVASAANSYSITFCSPVSTLAISASYKYIAFLHMDHTISVSNVTLTSMLYNVSVDFTLFGQMISMKWCGDLAPVVLFEGGLVFASADGTGPCWNFDGLCFAFTEIDSLYVMTNHESYRLIEVPDDVACVLSSIPSSDGAKLCRMFDQRHEFPILQTFDEIDKEKAVHECMEAAIFVTDPESQMFFLNCAAFCLKHEALEITIRKVRILNTLRLNAQMPITYEQQRKLTNSGIIKRLCYRRLYSVAAEIAYETHSSLINIGEDFVEYTITNIQDDKECLLELKEHDFVNFSYATMFAIRKGRALLANSLIENEKDLGRRSFYLGQLGKWEQAFETVTRSCNMSALYTLLAHSMAAKEENLVNKAIAASEPASFFTLKFPDLIGNDRIKVILELIDKHCNYANALERFLAYQPGFALHGCEGFIGLKQLQEVIGSDIHDKTLVGLSFNNTIRRLAALGLKEASKLFAKQCKVSESRFAALYVRSLIEENSYDSLKKFICKKKRMCVWDLVINLLFCKQQKTKAKEICAAFEKIDKKKAQLLLKSIDADELGPKMLSSHVSLFRIFSGSSLF